MTQSTWPLAHCGMIISQHVHVVTQVFQNCLGEIPRVARGFHIVCLFVISCPCNIDRTARIHSSIGTSHQRNNLQDETQITLQVSLDTPFCDEPCVSECAHSLDVYFVDF